MTAPVSPEPTAATTALPGVEPQPGSTEASRTARGALWLASSSIVVKTSQTVVLLILAALLAPDALGLVALGTLITNATALLANLGTANALVYWRGDVMRAARSAATIAVGLGGALSALAWVAAPWLADTFRAPEGGVTVIRGLTVVIPCIALAWVTGELQRRELAFLRRIIPDVVSAVIGAALAITLVLAGYGVMGLVVGQIVQAVLTLLLAWVVGPRVLPGWNFSDVRELLSYGAPYSGASLLEMVQLNLDYLFVSRVLGAAALGFYSLAFRLAYLPHLMIAIVITGASFPYLCRQRVGELGLAAERVATATLSLVVPTCLGVAVLAPNLVLLGDKWAPAVPVAALLAAYACMLSVIQLVQVTLNASGRPALSMAMRFTQVALLMLVLLVVTDRGIAAVAVAQGSVAATIAVVGIVIASRHVRGLSLRRLAVALRPCATAAVVMAVVMITIESLLPGRASVAELLVTGVSGVLAYGGVLFLLDRVGLTAIVGLIRGQS
jgi:O-antigen/teichoic acid export membrane protein